MKKLIYITILILPSVFCFGQRSKKSGAINRKPLPKAYYFSNWSLGFAIKSSNENIISNTANSDLYDTHYEPKFSYDAELFIERKLENGWILISGVNYHSTTFEFEHNFPITFTKTGSPIVDDNFINEYDLTFENAFECTNFKATVEYEMFENEDDYVDGESLEFKVASTNNLQFIGVPLALRKEFGHSKLKFSAKIGVEPAVLVKSNMDYSKYQQSGYRVEGDRPNYQSNRVGSEEMPRVTLTNIEIISTELNLNDFQLNSFLNIGLLHTFKYHTFFLEAEYKRGLVAFSETETGSSYFNSFGFKTGFIKRFKESKVIDMSRKRFLGW